MPETLLQRESPPLVLHVPRALDMTEDQFFEFCQVNRDMRIERTAEGDLVIMSPAGGETSHRNAGLTAIFYLWARQDGTGLVFDSSGAFTLPNGAVRAADVAWVERSRWDALSHDQRKKFPPLCPDFVLELRSPSDSLVSLQKKMEECLEVECLEAPASIAGDPVLPGFVLDLRDVWDSP